MRLLRGILVGAALVSVAPPVFARGRALEAVTLGTQKVRVDGLLREWPAKLDPLGDVVQGSAGRGDPSASGVIGYDDKNLYVAMKVRDKKLVRTARFGDSEDYASLELAFPQTRGFQAYSVRLYAGVIGKSAGSVRLGGSEVRGARIVEAPSDGGYTIEVSIPWSTFPEASKVRAGLRASLRYADADSGKVSTVIGTSSGSGASLPPLLLEAEQGLYRTLLKGKGLSEMPSRFAVGDICGDDQLEVVAAYGSSLTVLGSGYRGGKEFFFVDLALGEGGGVTRLDVQDLTGDGKDDIVVGKRVGTKDEHREVLQVLRVSSGDTPYVAFQQETAIVTKTGEIRNEVALKKKGGKVDIVLSQGKAEGFDPATYDEPMPGDMDSALLPWQTLKSRTFEWDGKGFSDAGSEKWEPKLQAPKEKAASAPARNEGPPPPPPPRPPSPDELLDRVYALYRQDRKLGIEKPRFDFVTDVAADRTPERVLIHGRDIVVFGKAFKAGTSYGFITIGVESPKDVLDATARDLTGDGKAEIIVRGVLHAKASKEMGGKTVDRQALFVYEVTESGVKRIFAAETGRSLGEDAILGGVRFVPKGRGVSLELVPGRAIGWTEKTYPFPIDKYPYGGLEALLVPWGDVPVKRYKFDGNAFVAEP
jgi:Carbohydrate family 9 binding domain-like